MLGVSFSLGKWLTGRIDTNSHGVNNGRKHLLVKKGKYKYYQNDDGSPSHGSKGGPPNSVKKELIKIGWDWDAKENDWINKIEYGWGEGFETVIYYPNGRIVTYVPRPLGYLNQTGSPYPSRNELLEYYTGPTYINKNARNQGTVPILPIPIPVPIPAPMPMPIPILP